MKTAVIIPVFNSSRLLRETLIAIRSSTESPDELIVVDDGSTDESSSIASDFGATVIVMPSNMGPSACRNRAALLSRSDLLVFLDADTCVHASTISQLKSHFTRNPQLAAVIGAYDDIPRDPGLCSQYRNLAHCYVHQTANRHALTFWSGCGAVRRDVFIDANGFDERFRRPSIEDIEFGYSISDRGAEILLDSSICVTHLKRWTVWNCISTDIFDRGIPWMVLLLERGRVPDDLNIKKRHRLATALTGVSVLCLIRAVRSPSWFVVSVVLVFCAICLDFALLRFIHRKRGLRLLAVAVSMSFVQNLCKLTALVCGVFIFTLRRYASSRFGPGERRSQILDQRSAIEQKPLLPSLPS